MKKIILLILLGISNFVFAQVGIGTTNPDSSSILELQSINGGFLLPRISLTSATDVTTIVAPAEGLMIYNLSSNCNLLPGLYIFDGSYWRKVQYEDTIAFSRLIRDEIGLPNVTFSHINSTGFLGDFPTLFNNAEDIGGNSFHLIRTGTPTGDWGFGITLPNGYFITSLILDGRNDPCCTDRIENLLVRLYRCGTLVYSSPPIVTASSDDNTINIPNIYADEIRLVVPNGANTGGGDGTINFTELDVLAFQ